MKVAIHVTGLKVPIPNAQYITEPGKISHTIPAKGIRTIPATEDSKLANTTAIMDFFTDSVNSHLMVINSMTSPIPIAQKEKRRVSRYKAGQTAFAKAIAGKKLAAIIKSLYTEILYT
ncbi:hypothetical protein [Microbulbifer variabilis]|uniref:hypothetical protein n=1 Tax=Microbulbifer variabilis TaxID=266805 RepID=UPI001CFDA427|nr:hypothetical protein [Microbulbifer variabilis]